jgi:glutathione synthase/RimK-type ligase-like ATP-grasp enzyme
LRIAFVTSTAYRDLTPDDHLAVTALSERGGRVTAAVWNDPSVDWSGFDSIVIRSTWDYHQHPGEYRDWIVALEATGAPVWNPPALLRWNMEKTYLLDLERAGIRIVPTTWVAKGSNPDLSAMLTERNWDQAVVKPVISAASNRTWRITREMSRDTQALLAESLRLGDVMVQPFVPEIQTNGEWSQIFLGGEFSHAVRKTPVDGDFRVQAHLGGDTVAADPGTDLIAAARRVLDAVPSPWLYARVDGIETESGYVLLELEMLEPSLYFLYTETGATRFADAIINRI